MLGNLKNKLVQTSGGVFLCQGGFGCYPDSLGTTIFGRWQDGREDKIQRKDIIQVLENTVNEDTKEDINIEQVRQN